MITKTTTGTHVEAHIFTYPTDIDVTRDQPQIRIMRGVLLRVDGPDYLITPDAQQAWTPPRLRISASACFTIHNERPS